MDRVSNRLRDTGTCVVVSYLLLEVTCLGLGIAEIATGSMHLKDCNMQPMIAIYLLVSGVAPFLTTIRGFCGGRDDQFSTFDVCTIAAYLFQIAWLICGSVWIYPNYEKLAYDHKIQCQDNLLAACSQNDCNRNFMNLAFVFVTLDWVKFLFLTIVMTCVILLN